MQQAIACSQILKIAIAYPIKWYMPLFLVIRQRYEDRTVLSPLRSHRTPALSTMRDRFCGAVRYLREFVKLNV